MAMSKRHYEAVAKIMQTRFEVFRMYAGPHSKGVPVCICKRQFGAIVTELADLFKQDNPNFDRKRFIEACCKLTDSEIVLRDFDSVEF